MLRADQEKPLLRNAALLDDGTVIIQRQESRPDQYIGWHKEDVFMFDASSFDRLCALYDAGKWDELTKEWEHQSPLFV